MRRKIIVAREERGWTVGREDQPFERFPSKERALDRARMLLERLDDDVELVVDEGPARGSRRSDG
jgi:hypothetical protein